MRLIDRIREDKKDPVVKAPVPNEVDSKFVMECLDTESEGDGMLFAGLLDGKLLYAASNSSWYVWQGNVWGRDKVDLVIGLVRFVTNRYGEEIQKLEERIKKSRQENEPEVHKMFVKGWNKKITRLENKIKALRQDKGRSACLRFAYTHYDNPFSIEGNEFDKDPWKLGVKNGIVDLRTGTLLQGRPEDMVSKQCSCEYVSPPEPIEGQTTEEFESDLEEWEQDFLSGLLEFIHTIYGGKTEVIEFIQMLLGYGLTGLTTEHVFPFFLGSGRNGKSLFISSVMRVMGDYAAMVPCELFLKSNQPKTASQADPGIMKLEGLRLAVSSEVEEGSRFSAQQIKRITGGDTLEGRNPYDKELRNFKPTHLTIMIGNHEPVPPAGDPAFWDRTFLVKHPVRFVKANPDPAKGEKLADPDIEEKLKRLDEQLLYWMVQGCLKWQANGKKLYPPDEVLKATEEYQVDADWLGQFIDACCTRTDKATMSATLYAAFVEWYRENVNQKKNQTPTQRAFGMKLKARSDILHIRKTDGVYYRGISLNQEWSERMLNMKPET